MADGAAIALTSVRKSFRTVVAVDDASFEVFPGEIFGLLGPNGAGKTTVLRLILDILRPDAGVIQVFGSRFSPQLKDRISYLPEERGLYARQRVLAALEYFGRLKGRSRADVRTHALDLLERTGMGAVRDQRVEELSKGNQQKIQVLAALVSNPDVIVFDEPFSGLDPLNARVISALIREAAAAGKAVLLSMHQMALVETLCERVFMLARGRRVLYGRLSDIVREHSDRTVLLRTSSDLAGCQFVADRHPHNGAVKVHLREGASARDLFGWLAASGADVQSFEQSRAPLEEIFVRMVQRADAESAPAGSHRAGELVREAAQ